MGATSGGVHGKNEKQVFAGLCEVIDEWVAKAKSDSEDLPEGMAAASTGWSFSGRAARA